MRGVLAGGLGRIGDFGLVAPLLAVALGWLIPSLAALGYAMLVPSIILMFAMTVAMVEPGQLRWHEAWPAIGLAICNLLLAPLLVHALTLGMGLDEVGGWVVLVAASPAAGAATLAAGLLGLPMRPMLLAQLLCFFALPLTAPLVATWMIESTVVDPWVLCQRVAVLVVVPSLLGLALRKALGGADAVRPLRGLGTLGVCGIGLALAHGLSGTLDANIPWATCVLALGLAVVVGGALGFAAGVLSGRLGGAPLGAAFALSGAVRNISLLWSATIGLSTPEGEAVMILGTLWTFVLPALLAVPEWQRVRRRRRNEVAASSHDRGQQRGMITPQFRTDSRTRATKTLDNSPFIQVQPGNDGPQSAPNADSTPHHDTRLSPPGQAANQRGFQMAAQPALSTCTEAPLKRPAQSVGRQGL